MCIESKLNSMAYCCGEQWIVELINISRFENEIKTSLWGIAYDCWCIFSFIEEWKHSKYCQYIGGIVVSPDGHHTQRHLREIPRLCTYSRFLLWEGSQYSYVVNWSRWIVCILMVKSMRIIAVFKWRENICSQIVIEVVR